MKIRGFILLAIFGALLVEQLPLDPALWKKGERDCCALAKACPMSARPASTRASGGMTDCDMDGESKGDPECSMRALCGSPAGGPEGAFWNTALARPALVASSVWTQTIVQQDQVLPVPSALPPAPGKSPPTPPPRWHRS